MQRLLPFAVLAVLSPLAHAQLDSAGQKTVNQAAFQLTKATVEFVATDAKLYGNRTTTTCTTCTDYASLIRFINTSKLTKADDLVRAAQKEVATLTTPTATTDQVLTGLKQYLHDRVTIGDGRERRKTLPGYKTYTTQVAGILAGCGRGARSAGRPGGCVGRYHERRQPARNGWFRKKSDAADYSHTADWRCCCRC